jgi:hypothetical protein
MVKQFMIPKDREIHCCLFLKNRQKASVVERMANQSEGLVASHAQVETSIGAYSHVIGQTGMKLYNEFPKVSKMYTNWAFPFNRSNRLGGVGVHNPDNHTQVEGFLQQ